ncbi:MAG: branched-chain amino acid ABC transporter permease [Anaerolineae bacterium]|nr:branched-chain amino acid ABC transporter permease [Anaerolineae bacterium]
MSRISILLVLVLLVILIAFPLVIESDSMINLAVYVLLFVALASSWNILGGFCGQTNLGHAAFFGAGALITRTLWFEGWHLVPSLLAGSLVAVALALLIGVPAFRLRGVYFAIGTLALSQILYITIGNMLPMMSSLPAKDLATYQLAPRYYLFLVVAFLTIVTAYTLINSKLGLGIMAIREEEDAAESLGVSALRHKLIALILSAFFGGLTGGAFAFYHVGYYPQLTFGPEWTFDAMMMAYIGGVGTIVGPIVGAIFFVILRELLALRVGEMHLIIFGTLFILVVLFVPGGFMSVWSKMRKTLARQK